MCIRDSSKYAVGIQLNKITSAENSEPIDGIAMLIAEAINGVKKAASVATISAIDRLVILFLGSQDFSVLTNLSP